MTISDDDRNEVNEVANTSNSGIILSDTNVVDTEFSDTAKEPSDASNVTEQLEKCSNEHKNLPDAASLKIGGSPKDSTKNKTSQPAISNAVVEIPEQPVVVGDTVGKVEKPRFIDATTQVEVPDKTTLDITSDPLVPALLDELSALK